MAKNVVDLLINVDSKTAKSSLSTFSKDAKNSVNGVTSSFGKFGSAMIVANQALGVIGAAFAVLKDVIVETVLQYAEFEKGVREVVTLSPNTANAFEKISDSVKKLSLEFGTDTQDQISGYYQAVSAGASVGAEATELLRQANILAIGGVSDLETAITGLVSVQNAFGKETTSVERINNAFFNAVKSGITRVDLLAGSVGQIATSASQAGVSVEEMFSAIAALTSVGVQTSKAVTQINASMTALYRPTENLKKLYKKLGITNIELAIKNDGLVKTLKRISNAVGGSIEALSNLLGRQEAARGVAGLTSSAYEKFNETMVNMETNVTAASDAHSLMTQNTDYALKKATASWKLFTTNIGELLDPIAKLIINTFGGALTLLNELFDGAIKGIKEVSKAFKKDYKNNITGIVSSGNKELDEARLQLQRLRDDTIKLAEGIKKAEENQTTFFGLFKTGQGATRFQKDNLDNLQKAQLLQLELIRNLEKQNKTTKAVATTTKNEVIPAITKVDEESVKAFENFKKSVKDVGKTQSQVLRDNFAEQVKTLEEVGLKSGATQEQINKVKLKLQQKLVIDLNKINKQSDKDVIASIDKLKDKYKDFGKDQIEIARDARDEELENLEKINETGKLEHEDYIQSKLAINDKYNQVEISENQKKLDKIKKDHQNFISSIANNVSKALSGGVQSLASGAVSAFADKMLPGAGAVAGQIFDLLSKSTDEFRAELKKMFDPTFLKNIAKNLVIFVEEIPDLAGALVQGVIEAMPKLAEASVRVFADPRLYTGIAKSVVKGLVVGIKNAITGDTSVTDAMIESQKTAIKESEKSLNDFKITRINLEEDYNAEVKRLSVERSNALREAEDKRLEILTQITDTKLDNETEFLAKQKELQTKIANEEIQIALDKTNELKKIALDQFNFETTKLRASIAEQEKIIADFIAKRQEKEDKLTTLEEKLAEQKLASQQADIKDKTRSQEALLKSALRDEEDHLSELDKLNYDLLLAKKDNDLVAITDLQTRLSSEQLLYEESKALRLQLEQEYNAKLIEVKKTLGIAEDLTLQKQILNAKEALSKAQEEEAKAIKTNNDLKLKEMVRVGALEVAEGTKTANEVLFAIQTALGKETEARQLLADKTEEIRDTMLPATLEPADALKTLNDELLKLQEEKDLPIVAKLEALNEQLINIGKNLTQDTTILDDLSNNLALKKSSEAIKEFNLGLQKDKLTKQEAVKKDDEGILTSAFNETVKFIKKIPDIDFKPLSSLGFAEGGIVPSGYPDDTYPARLTSGELVIPRSDVTDLREFLNSQKQSSQSQPRQIEQDKNLTVNLNVGEANLAKVLLNLNRQGFRTV